MALLRQLPSHDLSILSNPLPCCRRLKYSSFCSLSSFYRPKFRNCRSELQFLNKPHYLKSIPKPKPAICEDNSVSYVLSSGELIRKFVDDGLPGDAVKVFVKMLENDVSFEEFKFFPSLIKGFGDLLGVERVREIHVHLLKLGFLEDVYVANSLLGAYWKCGGGSEDAVRLFEKMPEKVSVSWNTMISGFSRSGEYSRSLRMLSLMISEHGLAPNRVACISGITSCSALESLAHGREIHGLAVKNGFDDEFVVSGLMDLYMKCGDVKNAGNVFKDAFHKEYVRVNTVIWNVIILGCVSNGYLSEAVGFLLEMLAVGVPLDSSTVVAVLGLCTELRDLEVGKEAHGVAIRLGVDKDVRVEAALIEMYFKCGDAKSGLEIFRGSTNRSSAIWGAIILNCAQSSFSAQALDFFHEYRMGYGFAEPAVILAALRACSSLNLKFKGLEIHGLVVKSGFGLDVFIAGALVDMYVKSRDIESAKKVFYDVPNRDVISWNALISGYAQNGCPEEALKAFRDMQSEHIRPNAVSVACFLSVCSSLSVLTLTKEVHGYLLRQGFGSNILINNSLIAGYAKCGDIHNSLTIFQSIPEKDQVSWNSILLGLSMHGQADETFLFFERMIEAGMKPDHATFSALLSACSHAGRIEEGFKYLRSMAEYYKLEPQLEQYTCVVDLLGRAGHLRQAYDMVLSMPCAPDNRIWGSLLAACKLYSDEKLAEVVADQIVKLDPTNIGYRVLLSNLYKDYRKQSEVSRVRGQIKEMGLKKSPGCSWIEVDSNIYSFIAGDQSHDRLVAIYDALYYLTVQIKDSGYVPQFSFTGVEKYEEIDDGDKILNDDSELSGDLNIVSSNRGRVSLDDDDLFDESLSLKNIGFSNVCLASLASGAKNKVDELDVYLHEPTKNGLKDLKGSENHSSGLSSSILHLDFDEFDELKPVQALSTIVSIKNDDYESLPSYMKGLASWEDLLGAVEKINSCLNKNMSGRNFFHQDEISSLSLGPKARSYLLLLVKMNQLKVETIDGLISYKIL